MIESIIRWSIGNRFFVLLATLMPVGDGFYHEGEIDEWIS